MITPPDIEDPKKFSERLNFALDLRKYPSMGKGRVSYLQEIFGLSRAGAHKWLHGKAIPHRKKRVEIAEKLGVNLIWLETGNDDPFKINMDQLSAENQVFEIPLFSTISAYKLDESLKKREEFEKILVKNSFSSDSDKKSLFAVKMQGSSMYPKISEGSIVLVDPNKHLSDGDLVLAAILNFPEVICRQYVVGHNRNYLVAINSKFETITIEEGVRLIGRVIEIRIVL